MTTSRKVSERRFRPRDDVRYTLDCGWELYCPWCADWWPLEMEFWAPYYGLGRCRACHQERKAAVVADRRAREARRAGMLERQRRHYHVNRRDPAWLARRREVVREAQRRMRSRKKAAAA